MVGRVATKFNAQVTEFYYFSNIRNSKCPHEDPLKRVAVKGRRRTSAKSCHWRAWSVSRGFRFIPNHAWVIMARANDSPLRPDSGHDLHERSPSRTCPRLGGPDAGGIQSELSRRTDRIARELWFFLAGRQSFGPIAAAPFATIVCGLENDSWQLLKNSLRQRMRAVRRRCRVDQSLELYAMTHGAV